MPLVIDVYPLIAYVLACMTVRNMQKEAHSFPALAYLYTDPTHGKKNTHTAVLSTSARLETDMRTVVLVLCQRLPECFTAEPSKESRHKAAGTQGK